MNNELKIKPLLQYELTFNRFDFVNNDNMINKEVFTAESHTFDVASNSIRFYRTGNLIREEFDRPVRIVITPVDEAVAA